MEVAAPGSGRPNAQQRQVAHHGVVDSGVVEGPVAPANTKMPWPVAVSRLDDEVAAHAPHDRSSMLNVAAYRPAHVAGGAPPGELMLGRAVLWSERLSR
jgi:hypothetical protein